MISSGAVGNFVPVIACEYRGRREESEQGSRTYRKSAWEVFKTFIKLHSNNTVSVVFVC